MADGPFRLRLRFRFRCADRTEEEHRDLSVACPVGIAAGTRIDRQPALPHPLAAFISEFLGDYPADVAIDEHRRLRVSPQVETPARLLSPPEIAGGNGDLRFEGDTEHGHCAGQSRLGPSGGEHDDRQPRHESGDGVTPAAPAEGGAVKMVQQVGRKPGSHPRRDNRSHESLRSRRGTEIHPSHERSVPQLNDRG